MITDEIVKAIKKARYDQHRTLQDVAGNAGVSISKLSQFLNGRVDIRVATLQKIFEDLKIGLEFKYDVEPKPISQSNQEFYDQIDAENAAKAKRNEERLKAEHEEMWHPHSSGQTGPASDLAAMLRKLNKDKREEKRIEEEERRRDEEQRRETNRRRSPKRK